jgi:hypothetical protein
MKTDNLNQLDRDQLRQIAVWCDWAEHHALREFERIDGDWSYRHKEDDSAAICTRNQWKSEIAALSRAQGVIRSLVEEMARKKLAE